MSRLNKNNIIYFLLLQSISFCIFFNLTIITTIHKFFTNHIKNQHNDSGT